MPRAGTAIEALPAGAAGPNKDSPRRVRWDSVAAHVGLAREKIQDEPRLAGAGRYELRGVLGGGRTGIVHCAYDRELGRLVALKTLRAYDADALYRLKREFRTLERLAHPNLVPFFELYVEDDERFFTMALVDGVDFVDAFRQRLESADDAAATYRDLRAAMLQLAAALDALHRRGVLHRDVKPGNVLVDDDGHVTVLDFGLSSDAVTRDDDGAAVAGTLGYLAPEQLAGRGSCFASDWFSAGAMLYEALTGRLPFDDVMLRDLAAGRKVRPLAPHRLDPRTPSDLEALALALLAPDPASRPTGAEVAARLAAASGGARAAAGETSAAPPRAHLVGRDAELGTLRSALQRSRDGLRVVEIVGPSGIGKTALAAEFVAAVARDAGATVLAGRCHPQEAIPFKALDGVVDELARRLARLPDEEIVPLLPADVGAARRLFPVLGRVPRIARAPFDAGPELDPSLGRRRASAALRDLLSRVAARGPLVVWIDDLQWGDLDSLALLRDLCRPPAPPAMLLVLAARSEAAETSVVLRALRDTRAGLVAPALLDRLEVTPLARADATRLVQAVLGDDGTSSAVAERIVDESRCSPFLASELARHLAGTRRPGASTESYEPPALDTLVAARVQALPALAREVLELVAVAGRPLERELVRHAETLGLDLRPALGLLGAQSLVCALSAGDRVASAIYHDGIRQAVLAGLSTATRRERHRALAAALEAESDADPRLLVDHYEGAGDRARAGELALVSGRRAAADLAFHQAAELYARARDLGTSTVPRWMLEARIGQVLTHAGRAREAAERYEAAANALLDGQPGDTRSIALRRRAGELYLRSGRYGEGLAALRTALAEARVRYPSSAYLALGSILLNRQWLRLRRALAGGDVVRPVEVAAADRERLEVYWSAGVGLSLFDMVRAADFQLRHATLAFRLGEPRHLARALATEAFTLAWEGGARNRRRSDAVQAAGARLAAELGDPRIEVQTLVTRAAIVFVERRFREALALCERGARICNTRHVGTTWEIANLELCAVSTLACLGEMTRARARMVELLPRAAERGDLYSTISLRIGLPNLSWLAADEPDEARRQIAQARAAAPLAPFQEYTAVYAETQVDLYEGAPAAGWARVNTAWPVLRAGFVLRVQGVRIDLVDLRARCALALVAHGAASRGERARLLRVVWRAAWRLDRERAPWTAPMTAALRAGVAWQNADRARAIALLADAAAGFERHDMRAHVAAARLHLAGVGVGETVDRCAESLRALGIADPARYAAVLLPGFAPVAT